MVQTRKRLKTAVFESVLFNSDILVAIGPFLAAEDFTNLASTSRHFGGRTLTDPHNNENAMQQNLSLMEKIARQVIKKEQTEHERANLLRYPDQSWISLYHQLVLLRKPIIFDCLVGKCVKYVDGDKSRVTALSNICSTPAITWSSAISDHVMRAGKHYVEVTHRGKTCSRNLRAGIMRPIAGCFADIWSVNNFDPTMLKKAFSIEFLGERNERWGDSNVNGCLYSFHGGHCCWSDWEQVGQSENAAAYKTWEGQENLYSSWPRAGNGTLGLLLDLDEGTLSVYKNGRRLGTMMSGLSGEYCWVVSMELGDDELSIRRANIPDRDECWKIC